MEAPPMNSLPPEILLRETKVADLDLGTIYHVIIEAKGNMAEAARILEVSRAALVKKVEGVPAFVLLLQDLRQGIVDKAESNVHEDVLKGDQSASRFILQTLGKDRGYSMGVAGGGKNGEIEVTIRTFGDASKE